MSHFGADIFDDEPPRKPPRSRTRKPAGKTTTDPTAGGEPDAAPEPQAVPRKAPEVDEAAPKKRAPARRSRRTTKATEDTEVVAPIEHEPEEAPPPPAAEAEAPRRTSRRSRKPARDQGEDATPPAEPAPPAVTREEPAEPSRSFERAAANPFDRQDAGRQGEASTDLESPTEERADQSSLPPEGEAASSDDRGPRRRRRRGRRGNRRHDDEFRTDDAAIVDPAAPTDSSGPALADAHPRAQGRPDSPAPQRERPHDRGQDRGQDRGHGQRHGPNRGQDRHHDRGPRRDGREARPFDDDNDDAPRGPLPIHRGGKPAPAIPVAAETHRIGLIVDLGVLLQEAREQGGELVFRKLHSALAAGDDVVHAVCFVPPEVNDSGRRALHNSGFDLEPCDSPAAAREAFTQAVRSANWPIEVLVLAGAPSDLEVGAMDCRVEFAGFGAMAGSRTRGGDKERALGKNCMFVP